MSEEQASRRILSGKDAYVLIVGNIIGIGIFTTSGYISRYVNDPGFMMLLWILGGFLSFCGGITYAELSTHFPKAGGDFHYLSHAFHPLLGFLFGWSALLVTYTGSIAVISVGFAHYFLTLLGVTSENIHLTVPLIGYHLTLLKFIAVVVIFLFTSLNVRGVRFGALMQRFFTFISITVVIGYVAAGFSSERGNWHQIFPLFRLIPDMNTFSRLGVALIGVYFTYSGWTVLAYIAGEIKDYQHTIPRATWRGVATVVILYVLINLVYLYALPLQKMENIVDIGYQALLVLQGTGFSAVFTLIILVAVISTLNATILSGARIYYAMSREGQFFPTIGQLHARFGTPARSLWLQCGWTVLLVFSGSFNQLLTYTVFIMVCFGLLSGVSLFIIRRKQSEKQNIYRAWGYPYTTVLYLVVASWILVNTMLDQPVQSLAGLFFVAVGIPFYIYFRKKEFVPF
jgi:APA family basic amino acid/polyamine antiporter